MMHLGSYVDVQDVMSSQSCMRSMYSTIKLD